MKKALSIAAILIACYVIFDRQRVADAIWAQGGTGNRAAVTAQSPRRAAQRLPHWPTIEKQLGPESVRPGSALEQLIRDNQDFSVLHPREFSDRLRLPLWLRVWWRKVHPEWKHSPDDPTGGYPLALKEIYEWMLSHQNLQRGPGDALREKEEKEKEAREQGLSPDTATIGGELRVSGAQSVARSESAISLNFLDPMKIIVGSNNITGGGAQGQYFSTDGGATWGQTTLPFTATDTSHSDPTADWTSDGRAWSTTLGIQSGNLRGRAYVSTNNGAAWTFDGTYSGATQTQVDKQMTWADRSATSAFKDNLYVIYHNGTPAFMNRRTSGGWQTPIQVSGAESTGTAIGQDVKTNKDGEVFGFWPTTGNARIFVTKSTNGGVSYGTPVQIATTFDTFDIGVPSFASRRALIYVSAGAYKTAVKNLVYAAWTDLSGETGCTAPGNEPGSNVASTCKTRIWFARSTDGGATWLPKTMINNQPGLNDQFNQWLVVDETNGGIGVIYYDTVGDPGRKKVDVWYQYSPNDGVGWNPPQKVTTAQTDETTGGQDSGNQFGDYNNLSGLAGTLFPSWTDRRAGAREEIWTAKITENGVGSPFITNAGATIAAGNCGSPATAAIDPGETVTVSFGLRNTGGADTGNLIATLSATGGVGSPSGPQNYGVLTAGGASATRSFSFTANGACGATLTATLQLQDGVNNLGTVTFTFPLGGGVFNTFYSENFDGVTAPSLPAGWTTAGSGMPPAPFATTATTPDTAPNATFTNGVSVVAANSLISPAISIPGGITALQLTFRHTFNFENSGSSFYDGGVLEISTDSPAFATFSDVTSAGGTFTGGGYVATLAGGTGNPLGGRQAWSSVQSTYATVAVSLPVTLAGQTIKFRWRAGWDGSVVNANPNWRIDSFALRAPSCPTCAGCPTISITPPALTAGTAGAAYSQALAAGGGASPYTFNVTAGALPPGLTLDTSGLLSGTPSQNGSFNFTVTATDANNCTGVQAYTLAINCPTVTVLPPALPGGTVGAVYSQTVSAAPAGGNHTFAVSAGALPAGLSLNATSGAITGTPTTPGTANFTITSTGFGACAGSRSYSITITAATGTITVNSLADTAVAGDGQCTLREAINNANAAGQTTGGECPTGAVSTTINFSVTGAINLAGALPDLNANMTINGPGPGQLDVHRGTGGDYRILRITSGKTVAISGLAITNGRMIGGGAGIFNSGTLALTNCVVSGHTALGAVAGGGIFSGNAALTLTNSTVSGNTANDAAAAGGGIGLVGGSLMLSNSTISGNTAGNQGGGLFLQGVNATLTNSTISGNTANGSGLGGGLLNLAPSGQSATATMLNCTVSNNSGNSGAINTSANSGAVSAAVQLKNTLVAANVSANFVKSGAAAAITSQGNNLDSDGTSGFTGGVGGNLVGTVGSPLNAQLAPLAGYGGPTGTHLLFCNSPALNAGTDAGAPATDQRGVARPAGAVDIGAFESHISLSPASLPTGTVGAAYSQTFSAGGGVAPYAFSLLSGTLPPGLGLGASGLLSGTPTQTGSFAFTVRATDAGGFAGACSYSVTITANTTPSITPVPVARQAGSPASNSTIATVSDAETAAGVLNVNVNGSASATVNNITVSNLVNTNGTITADIIAACNAALGVTNFTLNVSDGSLATPGTLQVTVSANSPPVLTYVNQSVAAGGSLTVNPATGLGDNGSISTISVLSQGAYTGTINVNSSGVVSISGAKPGGAHTITIRATDNCGATTNASFTLTVNCPTISLSPTGLPNGTVGTGYNQTVTAGGGAPAYSFTLLSGALPTGLSLSTGGAITGTPSAGGAFSFNIRATDQNGCQGTQSYSVTINTPPTISAIAAGRQQGSPASNSTIANVGDTDQAANTLTVTVNGSASATVNGVTVSGLSVSAGGAVTANIVANCTATNAGFTLAVTDNASASTNATLNVTVTANSAPTLSYGNQFVAAGGSLNVTPTTAGDNGSIASYAVQSVTPALTTAPTVNSSGIVAITNANPPGLHTITIRATDNCGVTADVSFTANVGCPAIMLSPATLPDGVGGAAYSQSITATGGAPSYSFAVTAGALPGGLTLTSGGALSGAPNVAGTFNFTVTATDADGCAGSLGYTINITATLGAQTRALYVQNECFGCGNQIYGYAVNETTGALTLLAGFPIATGGNGVNYVPVQMLAIDRANLRLYAINRGSDTVSAYSINATTGALVALPFSPLNLGFSGQWTTIAVHPTGSPLVVGDANGQLLSYQVTATTATAAAGSPYNTGFLARPYSTAFSQDGSYVYTGGNISNNPFAGFSVNAITGVLTALAGSPYDAGNRYPEAYATDVAGRLFMANLDVGQLRVFTTASGIPSAVSGSPFASGLTSASHGVLHPNNFYLVADRGGSRVGVYQISGSGSATTLAPVAGSPFASGGFATDILALNQTGTLLFAANANSHNLTTFSVNTSTGALTSLGVQPANTLGASGWLSGMVYLPLPCTTISLSPTSLPAGTVNTAYNQSVTASPAGTYNYSVTSGSLPAGLSLNSTTGAINGTPTAQGTSSFTITALSFGPCSGSQAYSIAINPPTNTPPSITPVAVARQAGSPVSNSTIATVSDAETAAGALNVNINGSASATVNNITVSNPVNTNGTITANVVAACNATVGVTNFTLNVSDGSLATPGTLQVTVSANSPPTLSYGNQSVTAGGSLNVTPTTAGDNGSITGYSVVGVTPPLTTAPTVNGSGVVAISNANPSGLHTVTIRATDNCGMTTDVSFTVNVGCQAITLSPTTLPGGTAGASYNQTITAGGGGSYNFTVSAGALPAGLGLSPGGALSGAPTQAGTFDFTVTATDTSNCTGAQAYTLVINCSPFAINPGTQSFAAGGGTGSVVVTGATGCAWTATGNAAWISITSGGSGSGNGTVNYSVAANAGAARSGTITIAGQTFTATQSAANTTAGNLDPGFGSGGKATTDLPGIQDQAYAMVIQPDGKIVLAGRTGNPGDNISGDFALARYNSDGTPDASFGSGGVVSTPIFGSGSDIAYALALQADGKLVAAGSSRNSTSIEQFALVRYNPNGTLDTGFGTGGKVITSRSTGGVARAVVIRPDGKIIIGGTYNQSSCCKNFVLGYFNSNGSLDTSFGTGGFIETDFSQDEAIQALVLQPDGKLVAVGHSGGLVTYFFALARYNGDGSLDAGFGTGGKVLTDISGGTIDQAYAAALQPDGKIVVAGLTSTNFGDGSFALARYNSNGDLDVGFGTGGQSTGAFTGSAANGVVVQNDGKIVAAGYAPTPTGYDFALARYNSNGSLDTSFGPNANGKVTTDFFGVPVSSGGGDRAYAIARQADGKIVAAGYATSTNLVLGDEFALARYEGTTTCTSPSINTPPANQTVIIGQSAGFSVGATGTGLAYQWRKNGVNISGATAGSFTINAAQLADAGSYDVVVTGACGSATSQAAALTVNCQSITVNPPAIPGAMIGQFYSQSFTQAGGIGTVTFSLTGTLPPGLGFNAATATISGTPTQANTFNFSITATDANNCGITVGYQIVVAPCPAITIAPATLPAGRAGDAYNQTLAAGGTAGPYTFSITGGILPSGMGLSSGGVLSGTPATFGTFNFTAKATDANGCMGTQNYTLTINPPCGAITIAPAILSGGFVGTPYNQMLTAAGGAAPYAFTLSAGALPNGMSLSTGGMLSGAPAAAGTFSFTVSATDNNTCTGTQAYTVIVSGNGLQFFPLPTPVRLLDTRTGFSGCTAGTGALTANSIRTQPARLPCSTIPENAAAITGNITVVPTDAGFLTLFPSSASQPTVANSNFAGGEVTNNVFTVGLGAGDGAFKIFSSATTHVIVDVTGYYAPPGTGGLYFHPLPAPVRLLETRSGLNGCIAPSAPLNGTGNPNADPSLDFPVQGRSPVASPCNSIPASAQVLVGNATSVFPGGGGYLTIYPSGGTRPLVASSNYAGNDVINGPFAVKLGADGKFKIYTLLTTHLVVDILGYYSEDAVDANGAGLLFNPLPEPVRLLETRPGGPPLVGCTRTNTPIVGNINAATHTQMARSFCGLPASAQAVVGNVSVVNTAGAGFLTLFPGNLTTAPLVATSNYPAPATFGYNRHYFVGLSPADGTFKVLTQFTTDLILDASGYFAP